MKLKTKSKKPERVLKTFLPFSRVRHAAKQQRCAVQNPPQEPGAQTGAAAGDLGSGRLASGAGVGGRACSAGTEGLRGRPPRWVLAGAACSAATASTPGMDSETRRALARPLLKDADAQRSRGSGLTHSSPAALSARRNGPAKHPSPKPPRETAFTTRTET